MAQNTYDFTLSAVPCSAQPVAFDAERCIGCNRCVDACQCDVIYPAGLIGKTPTAIYPGECCYCGACAMVCTRDAIIFRHPLMNQAKFVPIKTPEQ